MTAETMTAATVTVSRDVLVAPDASPTDQLDQVVVTARRIVAAAAAEVAVLRLGTRSVHRVDGWVSPEGLVLAPYVGDGETPVPVSVVGPAAAVLAWAHLTRREAWDDLGVDAGGTTSFDDAWHLVATFADGDNDATGLGAEGLVVAMTLEGGHRSFVARVSGQGGRWGVCGDGEALVLHAGSWSRCWAWLARPLAALRG